jgi:hypothetical protein
MTETQVKEPDRIIMASKTLHFPEGEEIHIRASTQFLDNLPAHIKGKAH